MPPEADAGDAEVRDLQTRLDAERAAVEHWRRIALQRSEQFAALRHRPSVRALLAAERRLAPIVAPVGSTRRHLRHAGERLALSAGALRRIGPGRLRRPVQESVAAPGPIAVRSALDRAITTSTPDMVGVISATTAPRDLGWLDRLALALDGSAVAAVPLVVHPHRPWPRATAHDGLVRSAGVALRINSDGEPVAESREAGALPTPHAGVVDVDAGAGAALLVDRAAYEAAGGLAVSDDLDAAAVELCARVRSRGGRVVMVPGAVVVDHRPVRARHELRLAVDPTRPGSAGALQRTGSALRRAADARPCPPLRFAVTVAAPSAKVADRWGDWHLAQALAGSLRRLGQEARVQTADQADGLAGRSCDVHLVLRGLQPVRRAVGQRHVLWIISHPETIDDDELGAADLVLVASPRFAAHLQGRTDTPVEVMLQATDHRHFRPQPVDPAHRHDLTIVAKTRDVLRPVVADALAAGLRPRIYGGGGRGFVDPELVVVDHIDNAMLPVVYSSAGGVLNDHWRPMRAWGFVSNRLFDVLACGAPVISDHVDGMDELFDGAVLAYSTPGELRALVDQVLADPAAARERAERGRNVVLAHHTFDHRARQLVEAVRRRAI